MTHQFLSQISVIYVGAYWLRHCLRHEDIVTLCTNWDNVKVAFPLSVVLSVGVDNQSLHWGSFFLTKAFSFNRLSWISLDVELGASFVPICIIILVGFFRIIGMIWWWLESSTVEPEKRLTLTRRPCPHNFSSTIPFSIESPTMTVVPIGHWLFFTDLSFSPA